MPSLRSCAAIAFVAPLVLLPGTVLAQTEAPRVRHERVPDGGLQPQLARGADGTLHLVYFRGAPEAGDVFYCRRAPGAERFSSPLRVDREAGSAIAIGSIRGAQLALGVDDRAHVVWNGSRNAQPRGPKNETPVLYTRLAADGASFEPERNVATTAFGLDGGACVAADRKRHVFVAWHAGDGEANRRVWLARSDDDGATFAAERAIDGERAGACGCCGMNGAVSAAGEVQFVYRAATGGVHRDLWLLRSRDGGDFRAEKLQAWESKSCPMSSAAFVATARGGWVAWENGAQIAFARLLADGRDGEPGTPPGDGRGRKHPRLAANDAGQVLLVWTEGTGWQRGGRLAWQLFDAAGKPLAERGEADGVPVWSFAAAAALPNGDFLVLH
jgi:hypothetical protein